MKIDKTRHRGRKPIEIGLRREICLSFRVNKYEHEQLKHLASLECIELAHYVREKTLKTEPPKRKIKIPEINQEYLKYFSSLSSNLNQITKHINTANKIENETALKINELLNILLGLTNEITTIQK